MKKDTIIEIISYAFIILFVYTSLSKWFLYETYVSDLRRSPELGQFAALISYTIPASELIVAGLLLFERTRKWGMYGAFVLMTVFTLYVAWVLTFTTQRPCTCGGIIRELSWTNHMIFNIVFTGLALWGIMLKRKSEHQNNRSRSIAAV